jgi:hypothetical protein
LLLPQLLISKINHTKDESNLNLQSGNPTGYLYSKKRRDDAACGTSEET